VEKQTKNTIVCRNQYDAETLLTDQATALYVAVMINLFS